MGGACVQVHATRHWGRPSRRNGLAGWHGLSPTTDHICRPLRNGPAQGLLLSVVSEGRCTDGGAGDDLLSGIHADGQMVGQPE